MARKSLVQKTMPPPSDTTRLILKERALLESLFITFTEIKEIKDLYIVGRKTVNCSEILANTERELKIL